MVKQSVERLFLLLRDPILFPVSPDPYQATRWRVFAASSLSMVSSTQFFIRLNIPLQSHVFNLALSLKHTINAQKYVVL